jgi:hypothetical protein
MHGINSGRGCYQTGERRSICFDLTVAAVLTADFWHEEAQTGQRERFRSKECNAMSFPGTIKNLLCVSAFALCAFAGATFADEFKSFTFSAAMGLDPIRVHGDQVMFIRNFTQEGGSTRGVVSVTKPPAGGDTVSVLTAAILTIGPTSPEVINSVAISGPADVSVTCEAPVGKNCFISFKKESN